MESILPGVFAATKKDQTIYYRASLTYRRKHISLGSYDTKIKAHLAYREAIEILNNTSRNVDDYSRNQLLTFEKWVSLINYRDNNIYFRNPIYTRQKFFSYYLSPSISLIFDIDDLFYYSSHKIMKRNGHLFVADYGMQYNILNRYGIKNYAVLNRDYRFINGNTHDFRYENIEILNRYHGICKILQKGVPAYKVKIHIRSYYQVGTYPTETEAAIAYNKAIDILHKNGIMKNYSPNFIDGLSNADYADIYTKLKVSKKLYSLNEHTVKTNKKR